MRAFWNWLATVRHPDEDIRRRSRTFITICVALIGVCLIALVLFSTLNPSRTGIMIVSALGLAFAGALLLTRRGYFTIAATLLLGMLLLAPIVGIMSTGRVTAEPIYFLLAPLIASVILRPRHIWLVSAISIIAMIVVITVIPENPLDTARGQALIRNVLITIGVAVLAGTVSAHNTHTALRTADQARNDAERAAVALERTNQALEQRVAERTAFLEATLQTVEEREARLARTLAENEQQRATIREMSVPVIPVAKRTLVMPLVGALDTGRLRLLQEQALQAVERAAARTLIIDITGVPVVDSQVAQGVLAVVQAVRLLGATVLLVGIRPEVAQAIVSLGLDLRAIRTFSDLESALGQIDARHGSLSSSIQPIDDRR